jgi:hypothetical protein
VWNPQEVETWLRANRGTPAECIDHLWPGITEKKERRRLEQRIRRIRKKLEEEGLDFSESRASQLPPRATLHALPPPAPRPEPAPPTVEVASVDPVTPSRMGREQLLAWAVDRAAVAVDQTPPDRGAYASNLNTLVRAHAELAELRAAKPEEEMDIDRLVEMLQAHISAVPVEVLELFVGEFLRRNPKARISA